MFKGLLPFIGILLFACTTLHGQGISGYMLDEENDAIPFAHVFVRQLNTGTISDVNGKYFMNLSNGTYNVVFSSVGYVTKSVEIIVGDELINKNIWLKTESLKLDEVVVSASRKDPAYEIIQKVIENKKRHLTSVKSSRSKVYIKAVEEIDVIEKEKKKKEKKVSVGLQGENPEDLFNETPAKAPNINLLEMELTLNYKYLYGYKEERTAVKSYGTKAGLYLPRFDETDFNFYHNLVELKDLAESPVISPISRTSILSYKYQLESIDTIETNIVYKIKVIPRKTGNSTCKGYLYINDGIWNINKLDFSFYKGGLKLYDKFRLLQDYKQINDTLWIPARQEFIYETKQGKRKTFRGRTMIKHTDFQVNYDFPEKFFNNEISVTRKEAYKKDSSFWNSTRPEPLTLKEREMVHYRDSVYTAQNSIEYKDSIDAKYNKITIADLLYDGIGFRDHRKKRQYYFTSLAGLLDFEVIGGWRFGPYASYFKRWENDKYLWTSGSLNVGLKNADFQGNVWLNYLYNPFKNAGLEVNAGRSFYSINPNDAYLNQIRRSNFILNDQFGVKNRTELINGLFFTSGFIYAARKSVSSFNSSTFIEEIIKDEEPIDFVNYESFITTLKLSYTPKQRYMTEPTRKVILGSTYPTFSLEHRKGWNGPFSSDIDFDYLEFMVRQKVTVGVLGNSEYTVQAGKFFNAKDLRIVDQKRFRQSDPYLYSDPLVSFQSLDTSLIATQPYFEAHHIHHFNGALVNNLPLIKKLRLRMVAGAGFLYVKESNYRHEELFVGTERVFKIGARRRLKIGLYGILAKSNQTNVNTDFKISFDIIDTWKRDWSY